MNMKYCVVKDANSKNPKDLHIIEIESDYMLDTEEFHSTITLLDKFDTLDEAKRYKFNAGSRPELLNEKSPDWNSAVESNWVAKVSMGKYFPRMKRYQVTDMTLRDVELISVFAYFENFFLNQHFNELVQITSHDLEFLINKIYKFDVIPSSSSITWDPQKICDDQGLEIGIAVERSESRHVMLGKLLHYEIELHDVIFTALCAALESANYSREAEQLWSEVYNGQLYWWTWILDIHKSPNPVNGLIELKGTSFLIWENYWEHYLPSYVQR